MKLLFIIFAFFRMLQAIIAPQLSEDDPRLQPGNTIEEEVTPFTP